MEDTHFIAGAELVTNELGHWPSFHDAEVIRFSVERAIPVEVGNTLARLVVHVRRYATTGEGSAQYQQVLINSLLVHFLFKGVSELEVSDFNHQNVINSIAVGQPDGTSSPLSVEIESIWGFGGAFRCTSSSIETVDVLLNAAA